MTSAQACNDKRGARKPVSGPGVRISRGQHGDTCCGSQSPNERASVGRRNGRRNPADTRNGNYDYLHIGLGSGRAPLPTALVSRGHWCCLRREGQRRAKSCTAGLIAFAFLDAAVLAAHEEYRRDFEVPEFRLSKAVIARHRFDFEPLPFPGFCSSETAIQHVGL